MGGSEKIEELLASIRSGFDEDENHQAIPVDSAYTPRNERLEARNFPIEQDFFVNLPP